MKELLKQVGEWPKFQAPDGLLRGRVYEGSDGRRRVHLASRGELRTTEHILNGDTTRVSYLRVGLNNDRAIFIGMAARLEYRGQGVGRALLDYFLENIEEQEDVTLVGTGRIHKPVIALCLAKAGFVPRQNGFLAELLPSNAENIIPSIRVLKNEMDPGDIVTGNVDHPFYRVLPANGVENHPQWSPVVVSLHTTYAAPENMLHRR